MRKGTNILIGTIICILFIITDICKQKPDCRNLEKKKNKKPQSFVSNLFGLEFHFTRAICGRRPSNLVICPINIFKISYCFSLCHLYSNMFCYPVQPRESKTRMFPRTQYGLEPKGFTSKENVMSFYVRNIESCWQQKQGYPGRVRKLPDAKLHMKPVLSPQPQIARFYYFFQNSFHIALDGNFKSRKAGR